MRTSQKEYEDCRFMPLEQLENAVDMMTGKINNQLSQGQSHCRQNVYKLQQRKHLRRNREDGVTNYRFSSQYNWLIRRAVYSHDWDTLLLLLRAAPVWEHNSSRQEIETEKCADFDIYLKAYTILLTHHPQARTLGLMDEFLHMAQGCRTETDKRALTKLLYALPDKMVSRNSHARAKDDALKKLKQKRKRTQEERQRERTDQS